MDIPETVVAAQAAADKAWAALEAYRKAVDEDRRKTAEPPTERHRSPVMRPWTDDEEAEYARLHAAAVQAAADRRAALQAEGVASSWDSERAIRAAVREGAEAE